MIFWISILVLLLIYPSKKQGICLYFFVIVALISAIRYDIGYDYINYLDIIIGNYDYDVAYDRLEFLPKFMINLSRSTQFSQLFFIITSILIIGGVAYFINKESNNKKMSILIFMCIPLFFWSSLSIIRQMMAVTFGLLMIKNVFDENKYKSIFYFLLAILSHNSAYILILTFLAKKIKFKKYVYLILFVLSFALYPLFYKLLANYGNFFLFEHALLYVDLNEDLKGNTSIWILFNVIFLLLYIILYEAKKLDKQNSYYFNIFFIGIVLFNVFSPVAVLAGRLSIYFTISLIVILPNLVQKKSGLTKSLFTIGVYIVGVMLYIYTIFLATSSFEKGLTIKDPYCPYKTVLLK